MVQIDHRALFTRWFQKSLAKRNKSQKSEKIKIIFDASSGENCYNCAQI